MARNIYVRLKDGRGVRRSIDKVTSFLFNDGIPEVVLEKDGLGTISKNMARRIIRFKPEVVHKRYHHALHEWLSDKKGIVPDERDWLEQLSDIFK